jgi:hypothetical protein
MVKNEVNRQRLLFTKTWRHLKFGCNLCKICWEKHHRAFVEVVEGSEIYNFAIYPLMHFSSSFGRKTWSKWPKSKRSGWNRPAPRRRPRPCRARPRHPRCTSRGHARLPKAPRAPRPLEVRTRHVEPRPRHPSAHDVVRQSVRRSLPCTCAPTKAAAVPRPRCRRSLHHEAISSCLFKDLAPTTCVSSSLPPRARRRPP